jgi:hypothetical protein
MPLGPVQDTADHDQIALGDDDDGTGQADLAKRAGAQHPVHPDLDGAQRAVLGSILSIMQR